jgi:serine/threonine-protein kinase
MNCSKENPSSSIFNKLYATQINRLRGENGLFNGRYQVERVLGKGSFGITFLAKDISQPEHPLCVIKQLCPTVNNPEALKKARQRFDLEAASLRQLGKHPQIPGLLNYFESQGEFYIVQEYIRGRTLAIEVWRNGSKSEAVVKQFLREVLPVLRYIHKHRVIHRDIKPLNLIHSQDNGRWTLIDFGGVKEQIEPIYSGETAPSTHFIGTAGFAAPEQMLKRPVYASDIYGLGVTCVYLLTGKQPSELDCDRTTGELCWQNCVQVSDYFAQVLNKMLKVSLEERYQVAEEVLIDLDNEPGFKSLSPCLSVQPPAPIEDNFSEVYLPPHVRTAKAIREWKARAESRSQELLV